MPTVARLPLGPMVNFAPRGPNESDPPDLLKFRVTPGAILIRLQKRKAIFQQSSPNNRYDSLRGGDPHPSSMYAHSYLFVNRHTDLFSYFQRGYENIRYLIFQVPGIGSAAHLDF